MIGDGFPAFNHALKELTARIPIAMNLTLTVAAGGAADRDIFKRTAETCHGVSLKMGEHEHGVIVSQVRTHSDFF